MESHAWQFDLRVISCRIFGDAGNVTCPLLLFVRPLQIPSMSASDHFVNCSVRPPGECVLTIFQPEAGQLYYLAATTWLKVSVVFGVTHQSRGRWLRNCVLEFGCRRCRSCLSYCNIFIQLKLDVFVKAVPGAYAEVGPTSISHYNYTYA